MKQQTAMQLMLWYLENEGLENSGAFYKAKHLLELEKEQMRLIYEGLLQNVGTVIKQSDLPTFEQYYNKTYKK